MKKIILFLFSFLLIIQAPVALADQAFDYTGDPHYQIYYNFARTHLFDGLDLFTNSPSVGACTTIPTKDQMTKWGITLTAATKALTPSENLKDIIYTVVCKDFQSTTFRQLVNTDTSLPNAKPISIILDEKSRCLGVGFTEFDTDNIHLCLHGNESPDQMQFYLTHELGHVIQHRNYEAIEVPWGNLFANTPLMNTLNCNGHWGVPQEECFSDALALYTTYKLLDIDAAEFIGIAPNSFANFDSPQSPWYEYFTFIKNNVFSGTTFFPTTTTSGNEMAKVAIKLVHDIATACPSALAGRGQTVINARNYKCLENWATSNLKSISQSLNQNLLEDGSGNLQCVAFARAAAALAGHPLTKPQDLGQPRGDAHYYQYVKEPGYTWYSKAQLQTMPQGVQPGDIAIFGPIPPGKTIQDHIGIVSSVVGNGKAWFYLAEANGGSGLVDVSSDRGVPYSATNNDFDGVFRLQ